jgi:hypothetical protein
MGSGNFVQRALKKRPMTKKRMGNMSVASFLTREANDGAFLDDQWAHGLHRSWIMDFYALK